MLDYEKLRNNELMDDIQSKIKDLILSLSKDTDNTLAMLEENYVNVCIALIHQESMPSANNNYQRDLFLKKNKYEHALKDYLKEKYSK